VSAAIFATLLALAAPAPADQRVAIIVGNDVGLPGEEPLDYAEADARRFHALLLEVGDVREDRAYLVAGGDADAVRRALLEATGRLLELKAQGPSSLIVYVSAHADEEALHLGGTRLPIEELRAAMARTDADLRLGILDGCRTAVRVKTRGGAPAPDVAVRFERTAEVRGDLFIRSASDGEPAQEWTYLRGGLFTHHLLVGLRGVADLDADDRVTLAEAYGYAYRKTVAQAVTGQGGAQHPSFDFDVEGFGEWVFSRPRALGATLALAAPLSGPTWIANRKNELVAELGKAPGEVTRVALAPGWYRVVMPDGATAAVADVNLAWGGTRTLGPDDFVRTPLSKARLRGADPIVLRPWWVSAGYGLSSGAVAGLAVEHHLDVRVGRSFGPLYGRLGVVAGAGRLTGDAVEVSQRSLRFGAGGGYGLPIGVVGLRLGLEVRAELVRQAVTRADEETIRRVFGQSEPARGAVIWGAGALVGASVPLTERLSVELEVEPAVLRVPELDGVQVRPVVEGRAGLAWGF
jgi:hypothetical protein